MRLSAAGMWFVVSEAYERTCVLSTSAPMAPGKRKKTVPPASSTTTMSQSKALQVSIQPTTGMLHFHCITATLIL